MCQQLYRYRNPPSYPLKHRLSLILANQVLKGNAPSEILFHLIGNILAEKNGDVGSKTTYSYWSPRLLSLVNCH